MTLRETLRWALAGLGGLLVGLLALAYAGLSLWSWKKDERFETVLVIENLSGQPVHDIEIAHNGEVVYRTRRLDPQEIFALSELNPLKGPDAQQRRGDIYSMEAKAAVAFLRDPTGREERHEFNAGGHSDISRHKCLFIIAITPRSIDAPKCIVIESPKRQTKPKN
jgi:hypothetical protein